MEATISRAQRGMFERKNVQRDAESVWEDTAKEVGGNQVTFSQKREHWHDSERGKHRRDLIDRASASEHCQARIVQRIRGRG